MMLRFMSLLAMAALTVPAGAAAPSSEPARDCSPTMPLPVELEDWGRNSSNKTIYAHGAEKMAEWPPLGGARTGLSLHRFESLRYWIAPERRVDPHRFGGMVPVDVRRPGRLAVALDGAAWIDLVRDGGPVKSAAHRRGDACAGIRKIVEFDVTPGRYLLQIVNAPESLIRAMAVMLPDR